MTCTASRTRTNLPRSEEIHQVAFLYAIPDASLEPGVFHHYSFVQFWSTQHLHCSPNVCYLCKSLSSKGLLKIKIEKQTVKRQDWPIPKEFFQSQTIKKSKHQLLFPIWRFRQVTVTSFHFQPICCYFGNPQSVVLIRNTLYLKNMLHYYIE